MRFSVILCCSILIHPTVIIRKSHVESGADPEIPEPPNAPIRSPPKASDERLSRSVATSVAYHGVM